MAPPKKNAIKMDLNSFLNDESFGDSWADDQVDLNNINLPIQNVAASNTIPLDQLASGGKVHLDSALIAPRRERMEFPIPDEAPYRARISNLPWDVSEEGIHAWAEDNLDKPGSVLKVVAPKDRDSERLRGWAFITFAEREDLVKALTLNGCKLNDRTVYLAVAAPRESGGFDDVNWSSARGSNFQASNASADLDWGAARGSNFRERKPRREDPDIDWSGARGSNYEPREHKPRREEPDIDWSGARGSNFEPRERKPRKEEADLDWGVVRGSNFEPRERKPRKDEPELDWGSARGSKFHSTERKPRRDAPELDWGTARNSKPTFAAASASSRRAAAEPASAKQDAPKIQSSSFDVLHVESDEEEDEENDTAKKTTETQKTATQKSVEQLEKATNNLALDDDDDEWKVVGKK